MAEQTAMISLSLKTGIGTFERVLIVIERRQHVLFFEFRQAPNLYRADRTSINPKKNSMGIFNQIKLILVIDLIRVSKSQLKRKIEFSN